MTDSHWDDLADNHRGSASNKTRIVAEFGYGFSMAQTNAKRAQMDDLFIGKSEDLMFAVFDGASGKLAASVAKDLISRRWYKMKDAKPFEENVSNLFAQIEETLGSGAADSSYTTALIADLQMENKIRLANLGDGRALLVRKDGTVCQITTDHHVSNSSEIAAAISRGGVLYRGRLDGVLLVTRSLGAAHYHVSAVPDVHTIDLTEDDTWLVLASDGVFEKLTNEQVARLCIENQSVAASAIVNKAVAEGVDDNCTVLCIRLTGS